MVHCQVLNSLMMIGQRIQVIPKDPNPLFTKWLKEWYDEAKEKRSKSQFVLHEALESLKRYPLPLETGRDCAILRGFGPKLCLLLNQKLDEYKVDHLEEYNKTIQFGEQIKEVAKKVKLKQGKQKKAPPVNTSPTHTKEKAEGKCDYEQIIMSPGSFKVVLLVDTQETSGKNRKTLDETQSYLASHNILYEVRRLGAGDFAWICVDEDNRELILPYIIERKRMDDFASSIRDGRFHEQKFRLRESKIQNLIYLIESYGNNQHVGLPMPTLMQAATNTQIHSGFQIKFTDNHRDSLLYIVTLTGILKDQFKDKVLTAIPKEDIQPVNLVEKQIIGLMKFRDFNDQSSKARSFTVKEIFLKQLLQLKSLSVDKALAITSIYPTPRALLDAYKACTTVEEGEKLLSQIRGGHLKRPIGLVISKIIYKFYNGWHDESL